MNGNIKKYDLEERLIEFSLLILDIVEKLPDTKSGNHFAGQLLRSGTSPALNYGEAQVAESRNDFIHKMKICLKELKELYIALQIIKRKPLITEYPNLDLCISECKELIAIFLKSIETANLNSKKLKTQHKKLKM
jgi:four helix bundle protein